MGPKDVFVVSQGRVASLSRLVEMARNYGVESVTEEFIRQTETKCRSMIPATNGLIEYLEDFDLRE